MLVEKLNGELCIGVQAPKLMNVHSVRAMTRSSWCVMRAKRRITVLRRLYL